MAQNLSDPDGIAVGPNHLATAFKAIFILSASLTPSSVNTITTAEQTGTVAGLLAGDLVTIVDAPARTNSVMWGAARVSAANEISITYVNPTAGNLTPPAGTYKFLVFRR